MDKDGKNGLQLLAFLDNGYGGYEVDKLEALWGNWEKQYQIKLFELESMVAKTK